MSPAAPRRSPSGPWPRSRDLDGQSAVPRATPRTTPAPPPRLPLTQGNHRDQTQRRDAGSGRRRADHLGGPRSAGHRRTGGHRRHRPAHHQVQAPRLPGPDHRFAGPRRLRRSAPRQGHRQLHGRSRFDRRRRGRPDRARRDPRQAARRLRRRRPDRRHDPRQGGRARDAVGDGPDRLGDRSAAVLRGRHRAADPGRPDGRQARQLLADAHRHPGARRPVRDARPDPAAPRPAGRDRRGRGQPRCHARPRHPGRHPDGDHRGSGLLEVRRPLGGRPGAGQDDPGSAPPRTWRSAPASASPSPP